MFPLHNMQAIRITPKIAVSKIKAPFYTMCPDKTMMVHTSPLNHYHKEVNYSGHSCSSRGDVIRCTYYDQVLAP